MSLLCRNQLISTCPKKFLKSCNVNKEIMLKTQNATILRHLNLKDIRLELKRRHLEFS